MGATSFALIMISAYPKGVFCVYILFFYFFLFFSFYERGKEKGSTFFYPRHIGLYIPSPPFLYMHDYTKRAFSSLSLSLSLSLVQTYSVESFSSSFI